MESIVEAERRKTARQGTSINGVLNCSRGSQMRVAIVDLSTDGFNAEVGHQPVLGGRGFSVKVPGLESLAAELRWTTAASAGFRFDHPLHPAVLDHVVRAKSVAPDND